MSRANTMLPPAHDNGTDRRAFSARTRLKAAEVALLDAARDYADATDGSHGDEPHAKAVALRLAAKDWRAAERAMVTR